MYKKKRILAVIPARSGSKRVKNKNLKHLNNKPLIQWTFEATNNSKYIDLAIVSSDSKEIMNFAENHGIIAPFKRPLYLSNDLSSSPDVVLHAIKYLHSKDEHFDICLLLQPTSPFRSSVHIDESIECLLAQKDSKSIISVTKLNHPLEWAHELGDKGQMDSFFRGDEFNKRSQDFPDRYYVNGAIYAFNVNEFLTNKSYFFLNACYAYHMSYFDSIDIDTYEDFELSEAIIRMRINSKESS